MQIVLLERIAKLGQMGDVVKVKDGYARNYLLPQGKALRATKGNLERFEKDRAQLEARNLDRKKDAEAVHGKLDGESFTVIRQSGDTGQLYGSVSTRDIAELLSESGFETARNQIILAQPIKILGLHEVSVVLHPEVTSGIIVNVARTEEEAERQAAGEDVTAEQLDEEVTIAVEEIFEEGVEVSLDEDAAEEEATESADEEAAESADEASADEEATSEEEASEETPAEEAADEATAEEADAESSDEEDKTEE